MEWIEQLTADAMTYIKSVEPIYAYLVLMLASIAENLFPPTPGDVITIFGASLVGTGHLSFIWVNVATTVGSTIGFMGYYYVGLKFGERFLKGEKRSTLFPKEAVEKTEQWFSIYGYKLILANRFLAGIRAVISIVSGMSRLNPLKVLLYSTLSAILWNTILISSGALIGKNWELIVGYVQTYAKWISVGIVCVVVYILIKNRLAKK